MRSSPLPTLVLLTLGCPGPERKPDPYTAPLDCAQGWHEDQGFCVPPSCSTGTWGELPVDESTVYVDTAAADGGDGSADAPLRSVQAGLDLAGSRGGGLVAVAAGTYPELLTMGTDQAGVDLAGRCRQLVTIDASSGDEDSAGLSIEGRYSEVEVSGLTVMGSNSWGIDVRSGVVRLVEVGVEHNAYIGIAAFRTGTAPTILTVERSELAHNTLLGIAAVGSTTEVTLQDTTIRDTLAESSGAFGYGINVYDGAYLTAVGCDVARNTSVGVIANTEDTEVLLVDTVVRDTQRDNNGRGGYGIEVHGGASVQAKSCVVMRNAAVSIQVGGEDTEVALADTMVQDTRRNLDGSAGHGIEIEDGATLSVQGCELAGNAAMALAAKDYGTRVALVDTVVRDTQFDGNEQLGYAVQATEAAWLTVTGSELVDNGSAGLVIHGDGTRVVLEDSSIRGHVPDFEGLAGYGAQVSMGSSLSATRCEFADNTIIGVYVSHRGTVATLQDCSITNTVASWGPLGASAVGLSSSDMAEVTASGLLARDNEGPGLFAWGGARLACAGCSLLDNRFAGAVTFHGAELEIRSSTISGTTETADIGGGVGVYAAEHEVLATPGAIAPSLLLEDSTITDNPIAGVWLRGMGGYRLLGNTISGGTGVPHGTAYRCGDGVYARTVSAWDNESGLQLEDNEISNNVGAGLFLDNAAAWLGGNSWSDNGSDLLLQGDACQSPRDDYDEAPDQEICPTWDQPSCELFFQLDFGVTGLEPAMAPRLAPTAPSDHRAGAHEVLPWVVPRGLTDR